MALNLRGNILTLGTVREQFNEVEMISKIPHLVTRVVLHELEESGEGLVVVEQ